jgi:hypothetical protein
MTSDEIREDRKKLREQEKRHLAALAARQRVRGTGKWPGTPSTGIVLFNANSKMAHLQSVVAELQPVCPHFDENKKEGWSVADWSWSSLPEGVARCSSCET